MLLEDLEKIIKPSPEPKYIDNVIETNATYLKPVQRFLNRYIFKRKEYAEIVRKQKEITERNRVGLQRKWIKKDIEKILDGEGLSDYMINQVVDYILERENK